MSVLLFKRVLFFIFSSLTFLNFSHAIIGGLDLDLNPEAHSLIKLEIDLIPLPIEYCSGSYIESGWILTAMHCLIMNEFPEGLPGFCFSDYKNQKKSCFKSDEIQVFYPKQKEKGFKAKTRRSGKIIEIQIPDIALIKVPPDQIKSWPDLQIMKIPGFSAPELNTILNSKNLNLSNLFISGQGGTTYNGQWSEPLPGIGEYRYAPVTLNEAKSSLIHTSTWNTTNNNSGPVWGDSGGPLYLSFPQSTNSPVSEKLILQIGVISNVRRLYDKATGQTNLVTAYYSRLDHPDIIEWIQQTIHDKK